MSGQSGGHRLRLSKLNEQLTCKLCGGYFIDATTIIECLHSFCRSCIVKYLENNKYCPICEVQVHKSRPLLNIRPDHTLQDIVYKLVPGCYQNEMRCRREFYAKHPEARVQAMSPEARGEPIESHIYSPDESLSLSLEYFNPSEKDANDINGKETISKTLPRRYLRCPAAVTVFHLQKLIRAKYGLTDAHRVDIMYKEEPLCSSYTLMDVMYIYHWRRKVPLHLSYRIFESSPKRIKLSEDNSNYKRSLSSAGIDPIESKDEHSLNREWKEVQLKISETGVMSVTDISSPESKRSLRVDNIKEQKGLEGSIAMVESVNKSDSLSTNLDSTKPLEDTVQNAAHGDTHIANGSDLVLDTKKTFAKTDDASETKTTPNITSAVSNDHQETNTSIKAQHDTLTNALTAKNQNKVQETEDHIKNNNEDGKSASQVQALVQNQKVEQTTNEEKVDCENLENAATEKQQISSNNNNISTEGKAESPKQNAKGETKTIGAGSKIDALSAKLLFQPKIGQVNNTYSKKAPKEKRTVLNSSKRSDIKADAQKNSDSKNSSDGDHVKTRKSAAAPTTTKVTVSSTVSLAQQQPVTVPVSKPASLLVSSAATYVTTPAVSMSNEQQFSDKVVPIQWSPNTTTVNVQQALSLLEQRINSPERASMESVQKTNHASHTTNQKMQYARSNNIPHSAENMVSIGLSVSAPGISQATTTFPYTVHDLVSNAMLKSPVKNSSIPGQKVPTVSQGNAISCTVVDSQTCSMPQINIQTPSMSIYSISTSLKNTFANTSQSMHTTTATTRQTLSKPNFEMTSVYSIPPCPDAIPISLMKPTIRKQEIIAKGTNLNEICAKIGTSGSKINDICAKIGENTKEKSKAEARSKADIPELLKIAKKTPPSSSSSPSSGDTCTKHIPNIPNVPIYTPSNTATATESKMVYSSVKDNTKTTMLTSTSTLPSHGQKAPSAKKQSQPVGYKTLRDPPKSWNPTLSKNNYVAAKNQAKEMQNQAQSATSEGSSKPIQSKPAKIFKMRNMPRYLGNPASGVKPMYGVTNDTKEKEQSTNSTKNTTLSMMKIDPKTLSPIVSTVNSPIVSPPPYSPNARSYQNTPFPRDICRNTGSPISPRNSPVNMLSTNPFIPSPTPNTNPRLIYSHFPPPFPDASRFPNPLIRSPIGIPPPSAFHSSLPPSINKLYQRSSYIPQTTGYSPVSQPPTVQRIPPSTHSSSPKSPKTSSPSAISPSSFNSGKPEAQSPMTSTESATLQYKSSTQQEVNAFNLSKTGGLMNVASDFTKTTPATTTMTATTTTTTTTTEASETQNAKPAASVGNSSTPKSPSTNGTKSKSQETTTTITTTTTAATATMTTTTTTMTTTTAMTTTTTTTTTSTDSEESKRKEEDSKAKKDSKGQDDGVSCKPKVADAPSQSEKRDKGVLKVNGDVSSEHFGGSEKSKNESSQEKTAEKPEQTAESKCTRDQTNAARSIQGNVTEKTQELPQKQSEQPNEDLGKANEQIQGKKAEVQRNKPES